MGNGDFLPSLSPLYSPNHHLKCSNLFSLDLTVPVSPTKTPTHPTVSDMFKLVHHKSYTVGKRAVGIRLRCLLVAIRNSSCGKVIFLHLSVSHSVHRGVCVAEGHVWQEGAWQAGVCGRGGVHDRRRDAWFGEGGVRSWQERRPLQRTVRILLECILVNCVNTILCKRKSLCELRLRSERCCRLTFPCE